MLGKSQTKYIQSLGQKKVRDEQGVFVAEGPKIVAELLASANAKIQQIYALPDWIKANHKDCNGVEIVEADEKDLEKISQLTTPNKVLAVIKKFEMPADIYTKGTVSLVLDTIQDPGNLGTIIRTADWFGIEQIFCSNDSADMYNPKVVQSTMGSIFRVNMIYNDLSAFLDQWPGIPVLASSLDGSLLKETKQEKQAFLVIGNESRGISQGILQRATVKVRIPGGGDTESLNASVATGILLYWLTVDS